MNNENVQVKKKITKSTDSLQICGFKISNGDYAIPVLEVQEVVKPQRLTPVPLAPDYIDGLINLRGQIVTAINLRVLFGIEGEYGDDYMNIIVRFEDNLYALVVDEILDVIDVSYKCFEETPEIINEKLRKYLSGVFKLEKKLLTLISLDKVLKIELS